MHDNGLECLIRCAVHPGGPRVHQARPELDSTPAPRRPLRGECVRPARGRESQVFVDQRACEHLANPTRPHREHVERAVVLHHGRVPHPVYQLSSHLRVDRRDQRQPEAREPRREQGHGNHQSSQPSEPGVLPHEIAVGHPVGSPDLVDHALQRWEIEGLHQIRDEILDADRLSRCVHPAWGHHRRELLHQCADQLERKAPGADHDRGAELDRRDARQLHFRASIVIDSGSLPFELVPSHVKKLPAMRWSTSTPRLSPIAIEGLVASQVAALEFPARRSVIYEIGGPRPGAPTRSHAGLRPDYEG